MTPKSDPKNFSLPVIRVRQPIGEFFMGVLDSKRLCEIAEFDIRRLITGEREVETYLGIQRPLDQRRVKEIAQYVRTVDACFPTSIILAVPAVCARFDPEINQLTLSNYPDPGEGEEVIPFQYIARVLDGQHRIAGLEGYEGPPFEVNVCIFIDLDIAEQGYIFSTVNLAQTKVNKSLVYDLFDYANAPSPQKLCHNIAVALDKTERSPFYQRIKRLGVATEGRFNETITQATFVEALIKYMSSDPVADRDLYKRGGKPPLVSADESKKLIFRNMMIRGKELEIVDVLWNYFDAVRERWQDAWNASGRGIILNKTNGFRALMRFLRHAYLDLTGPGGVPKREEFVGIFRKIKLKDNEFNTEIFLPGTSGEGKLYRTLCERAGF